MSSIKQRISSLFDMGFFHIFGANLINKILAFVINILIARFLTKGDYGIFSYANSIYSAAALVTGFGLLGGVFQYCSESRSEEEKLSYRAYGLKMGLFVDGILAFGLIVAGLFIPLSIEESGKYLAIFGPLLLFDYIFQYFAVVLRSKRDNKRYAYLQNINTSLYCILGSLGACVGGILGTIIGRYVAYVISIVYAASTFNYSTKGSKELKRSQKRAIWRYSLPSGASNVMNQMTYLLDVFLVGLFVMQPEAVAEYKVASMIPEGIQFVPMSIMTFVMPYFIEHNHDELWFKTKSIRLIVVLEAIMVFVSLLLICFAPEVITLLWGETYLEAVVPFRIIAASLLITPLRTMCINLLAALREVRANFIISCVTLILNVVLTTLLTMNFGIVGAAAGVTCVSSFASLASAAYFIIYFRTHKMSSRGTMERNKDDAKA